MEEYENPLAVITPPPEEEDEDLNSFLTNVDWKSEAIEEQIFDPTMEDLPVQYTLEWENVPFAPLGGIAGMNGRPGNGKTMSFSIMIAAILRGEYMGLRCLLKDEPTVLYIDTEMEMVNTQRTVRRIYEMVGWEHRTKQPRLNTIMLREVNDAISRWRKILKAIWMFKPTVVFLDGLIDVVADFNDNKECQERIYQCMSVSSHYNISLWCLLHLNPGSDKAVGHLGSFLERKATDIWLTAQDKETQCICISHEKHRMKKATDINYTVMDDERHYGIPQIGRFGSSASDPIPAEDAYKMLQKEKKKQTQYPSDPMAFFRQNMPYEGLGARAMREMLAREIGLSHQKADDYCDEMEKRQILVHMNGKWLINLNNTMDENNAEPF